MATTMELENLVVRLSMDGTSYLNMLNRATTATQSFGDAVMESVRDAGQAFNALSKYIAGPVALLESLSVRAFAKFNLEMTKSTSIISNLTEKQRADMEDLAKTLSMEGTQGPAELAKAYFYLASAGLSAEQSLAALPAVQKFAIAGAFDLDKATTLAADAQAALGLRAVDATQNLENMTRVMDVLVKANVLSNANVEQFSVALTHQAGAAAKAFHKDVEEVTAALAAFAQQGVKAELAGNTLSRMYRILADSAVKHADEHKRLGLQVFDANGRMRNTADLIENLEKVFGGMSEQLRTAEMDALGFEIRLQQSIMPLLGTSKAIRDFEKQLRSAGGELDRVSGKQMEAFTNQMLIIWHMITIVAIEIGARLEPAVTMLGDAVAQLVKWFRGLEEGTVIFALVAVSATAALVTFFAVAIGGFLLLNTITAGMPIIMGLLLAGIVAVSVAIAEFVNDMGGIKPTLEYLKNQGEKAWEWVKPIATALGDFFRVLWFVIRGTFDNFVVWAVQTWDSITGGARVNWQQVRDFIIKAIIGAEWVLLNFKQTAELVWAGIKYYAIATLNAILGNMFTVLVGPEMVALWVGHSVGWRNLEKFIVRSMVETFSTLLARAALFGVLFWKNAFGKKKEKEPTSWWDEFIPKISLKGIEFKSMKALEEKWKKEYEALGTKAAVSFDEFYQGKLKELADKGEGYGLTSKGIAEREQQMGMAPFEKAGENLGQWMGKGIKHGVLSELGKFDAALYGSLEFLDRLDRYRASILGEDEGGGMAGLGRSGGRGAGPRAAAGAQVGSVEALDRKDKNTDKILADIRDILYDQSRKRPVNIEAADMIV